MSPKVPVRFSAPRLRPASSRLLTPLDSMRSESVAARHFYPPACCACSHWSFTAVRARVRSYWHAFVCLFVCLPSWADWTRPAAVESGESDWRCQWCGCRYRSSVVKATVCCRSPVSHLVSLVWSVWLNVAFCCWFLNFLTKTTITKTTWIVLCVCVCSDILFFLIELTFFYHSDCCENLACYSLVFLNLGNKGTFYFVLFFILNIKEHGWEIHNHDQFKGP